MAYDQILKLYAQIPKMTTCEPGCTRCCGPVPFTPSERAKIGAMTTGMYLTCPFVGEKGCEIYENRPFMCRLFGAADVPLLRCPRKRRSRRILTSDQAAKLAKEYTRIMLDEEEDRR